MKKALMFFMFCAVSVFSQTQVPHLEITFPADQDTFAVDRLRLSGNTQADAILTINDKPVKLLHHGAFVTRIDLQDGMNKITAKAVWNGKDIKKTIHIYRPPKLQDFSSKPTSIDPLWVEPQKDVWIRPGDYLDVLLKGSPQGQALFEIEKLGGNYTMTERPPQYAKNLQGVYQGSVQIPEYNSARALEIKFQLKGLDGRKKVYTAPGKLHILPTRYPLVGVTQKKAYIQSAHKGHAPLQRIPAGIFVHITGRINDRYKIQLGENLDGWIDVKKISIKPIGTPIPNTGVAAPQPQQTQEWLKFIFPLDYAVPFIIEKNSAQNLLDLKLFGAHQVSHWITFPNTPIDIKNLVFKQTQSNILHIQLETTFAIEWGYRAFYQDGALHLYVRRPPLVTLEHLFRNVKIAIDAGHGGSEEGAVGAMGLKEKDVNLSWAQSLANKLRDKGAQVIMIRSADDSLSLADRVQIAQDANAHIYLSLHNNATGPSGNALRAGGTSVYFTLPQNKELCWAIYPYMTQTGLAAYGKIYNSYYLTTTPSFLVALIEGCFITNPNEELLLMDEAFIDKMAQAVCNGVEDYLRSKTKIEQE